MDVKEVPRGVASDAAKFGGQEHQFVNFLDKKSVPFWLGTVWDDCHTRILERFSLVAKADSKAIFFGGGVVESTATEFAAAWSGPFSVEGGGGPFSVEGSGGGATRLVTFVGGGIFQRKTDKILQGQIN